MPAAKDKEELPSYLKGVDKKLIGKEEHPAARVARHAAHHAKRAVQAVKRVAVRRPVYAPKRQARPERPVKTVKKSWGERWDDLTDGPFGTLIYIALGILIALAVNEGLKPILLTDTPVVAVFSESMLPTFEKGDMIIVQGGTTIKAGDIVVYDAPVYKYPIIHRVINVTDAGVVTKGDNNASPDPWVTPKDKIHGKAIMRIPYLGWVKVETYELMGLV
jgi:signal peptidase